MKPSEIIEKKYDSKLRIFTENETYNLARQVEHYFDSITEYLDEQYEKYKPCEHRSSTGTIHSNGQLLCDKCGQFFSNL